MFEKGRRGEEKRGNKERGILETVLRRDETLCCTPVKGAH